MEDSTKVLFIFVFILGFFPIFYLFMPVYVIFGASVVISVVAIARAIHSKEYEFIIPVLTFSIISAVFVIRYTATLQLLFVSDILKINEGIALAHIVTLFFTYLPVFIVFAAAFAILYAWGFVQPGRKYIARYARVFGYIGIILMVTFIFLDMMVWDPSTTNGDISVDDILFEIPFMNNPIKVTYEMWYFIQFSIWTMSTYTFVTGFLLTLTGSE